MTTPIRPKVAPPPPPPKPVVRPAAKPQPIAARDELSTGQGQALRAQSVHTLQGSPTTTVAATPAQYRVDAGGGAVTQVRGFTGTPLSDDVKEQAEAAISNFPPNPSGFANALQDAEGNPELRRAIIAAAFDSGYASAFMTGETYGLSRKGGINEGYDDFTEIADAVGEAYEAGDISDEQLRQMAEDMGPEQSALFVQALALGTGNGAPGNVVEAFGEQAEALGYDQAAALAFTSNGTLLREHYPTAEAQREAFNHVNEFIEQYDDNSDLLDQNVFYRNAVGSAVVNAARLTAEGNGYTPEQLQEELDELGPTLSGELIAQAGENPVNIFVPGPLDVLGDAATALAGTTEGDDQKSWQVNAAIAYTQSSELIDANLTTDEAKKAAFDSLNGYLAEGRGEWDLASRDGYSLVRAPQAVEGLNNLLAANPEMITDMLDGGAAGEADLVQLYESIALNPDVSASERAELQNTLESYVEDQLSSIEPGNANEVGERLGKLFGTIQVAADRAVEGAEAEDTEVKDLALELTAGIAGIAAEVALTSVAGPLGAGVGGLLIETVLGKLFESDPPEQSEIQNAFVEKLKAMGIDVSAGEVGYDQTKDVYQALQDELTAMIAAETDPAKKDDLQTQLNVVNGVLDGLDGFGDTQDSSEGAGELATELNRRNDDP